MARIVHIAMKVDDLDGTADFYEQVFSLPSAGKSRSEDRSRRAVSDGNINLTFLKYDSEESPMAKVVGQGPCIHHFAVEVDDLEKLSPRHASLAVRSSAIPARHL